MRNLNEGMVLNYGITAQQKQKLFESWAPHVKALELANPDVQEIDKVNLVIALENMKGELALAEAKLRDNHGNSLFESTQVTDIQGFKRYAFELITGVLPNLVANEIVSVQTLKQKIGQIFYMQYTYGTAKGSIAKGDVMFSPWQAGNGKSTYTDEAVEDEELVAGASGNLAYTPVKPGTVHITDGETEYTDKDGDGKLYTVAATPALSGTIDYTTGKWTAAESIVGGFTAPVASYSYDLEYAPSQAPELDLQIKEIIVRAKVRKLRAKYAFDAAYDIQQQHGVDLETELAETAAAEIRHEIDNEIINDLLTQAGLSSTWNIIPPVGVTQDAHYKSFVNQIIADSNKVFQATRRASANFIVCGKLASDVIESLPLTEYVPSDDVDAIGPHLAGNLKKRWKVVKNPFLAEGQYLIGYKGKAFIDAGYVYAPYLPVFSTKALMLDDFIGRQGFATSYAKRMLNANYYVKGTITQVEPVVQTESVGA